MKKRSYISILSSVLFALYFVFAASVVNAYQPTVAVEQNCSQNEDGQDEATFSELSLDVIIPSYAFDFGSEALLVLHPQIVFIEVQSAYFTKKTAEFYHSFFEKVFEHIIAPNAP